MNDLEPRLGGFMAMPPPFLREGYNPDEPIMIGSSDDEDELGHRPAGPGRGTIAEQRARLHNNRTGTPIPRALENGLRIMSPPPPVPNPYPAHWHRRPDWPHLHQHHQNHHQSIQQRLAHINVLRSPEGLRRLLNGHENVGRILNLMFPGMGGDQQPQQPAREAEYDVRMTHARAKPRIGFSYDFAPDEEEENADTAKASAVRTRTTIVIPDSPPLQPVDRKGKGRAKTPLELEDILDLESGDWVEPSASASTSASSSASTSTSPKSKKRRAVETIEILSDEEEEAELEVVEQSTVLVCASCQRPLRMGGARLWALRCGHVIDSRCYRKLGERPIVHEDEPASVPVPAPEVVASRPHKRRRTSGGRRAKAKPVVVAPPPVVEPHQAEILEWRCPVSKCGRAHWSERMVTGAKSVWQPMKETGAVGVFV
ncbi:WD domain, G-beta repeat protein [Ceratobasidium sp. AG-Ba]|nr:WD domain, G-beta repeat protein [Ceratobasidium sp. AG-Ba]